MSEHSAIVEWQNDSGTMEYPSYSRRHAWRFDAGISVPASAGVDFNGNADCVDPEEALVAAAAGCHMLTFLAIASRRKLIVASYRDHAIGHLEKNEAGQMAVTRIDLHPQVAFGAGAKLSAAQLASLHDAAHRNCFIANSIRTKVSVHP
ncbi:MAG: OsmC family peroxiredoxin [Gammaproteobacteria bacterium]|nr:OsmC family peroxiredoxin [Gammaproteobacteria bacterium]